MSDASNLAGSMLLDLRTRLKAGAASAALLAPAAAFAQSGDMDAIRKAVAAGHGASVKRVQD